MRGLVATHGDLGRELVRVVEMITGPQHGLTAMTNHGKSAADLTAEIRGWLEDGADPATGTLLSAVLFIDDHGGSCANAALLACRPGDPVVILSGVNLAMLLGFLSWREELDPDDLAARLVTRGRDAITRLGGVS